MPPPPTHRRGAEVVASVNVDFEQAGELKIGQV
ncbi:septum site-determining protein MinC, partial [Xanthomonas oryzae pv. oryzae]